MKLLTEGLAARFKEIGSQEDVKDPIFIAKFFNPCGAGTWYATEYNPEEKIFFGYVSILGDWFDEWGSFSLKELETYHGNFGLEIERDLYCGEFPISRILNNKTGDRCECFNA